MRIHGLLNIQRKPIRVSSDQSRVIARLFLPPAERVGRIIRRVLDMPDVQAEAMLEEVRARFSDRHRHMAEVLEDHYRQAARHGPQNGPIDRTRRLLIGSFFTMEYAIESAALFNPSIVPHPDQSDLPADHVRIVLSFRATGEGHISSLEFRSGVLTDQCELVLDPVGHTLQTARLGSSTFYDKHTFGLQLLEQTVPHQAGPGSEMLEFLEGNEVISALLDRLDTRFTHEQLQRVAWELRAGETFEQAQLDRVLDRVWALASSNYEVAFDPETDLDQRVLFPVSGAERCGIEDARFVRFVDDEGEATYYATYSAFDGSRVQVQLLETCDFETFRVSTLNGRHANSKGMALLPRKINQRYCMTGRTDGENMDIIFSNNIRFWHNAQSLCEPTQPWEFVQIGNCGSPLETEAGWLLLTHGVGPMRRYCIGAVLLDRDDPRKVIGRLKEPLLSPTETEREGYVPNVVYTCGSMIHCGQLIVPYAMSDVASSIAVTPLEPLLELLTSGH